MPKLVRSKGSPLYNYHRDIIVANTIATVDPANLIANNSRGVWPFEQFFVNGEGATALSFTAKNIPTVIHFVSNTTDVESEYYDVNYQGLSEEGINYLFKLINTLRPADVHQTSIAFEEATQDAAGTVLSTPGYHFVDGSNLTRTLPYQNEDYTYSYTEHGMAFRANASYRNEPFDSRSNIVGVTPSQISDLVTDKFPPDQYLNIYIINHLVYPSDTNKVPNPGPLNSNNYDTGYPLVIPAAYGDYFLDSSCGLYICWDTLRRLEGGSSSNLSYITSWTPTDFTFGDVSVPEFKLGGITTRTSHRSGFRILKGLLSYFGLLDPSLFDVEYKDPSRGFELVSHNTTDCTYDDGTMGDFIDGTPPTSTEVGANHNGGRAFLRCGVIVTGSTHNNYTIKQVGLENNLTYIDYFYNAPQNSHFTFRSGQLSLLEHNFNIVLGGVPSILTSLTSSGGSTPIPDVYGCTDPNYQSYNPLATVDDGTCSQLVNVYGCTDSNYMEYNPEATVDDGTCLTAIVYGCTNANYLEYSSNANMDDGSCQELIVYGCTNELYAEYKPQANVNDGSCSTLIDTSISYETSLDGGCSFGRSAKVTERSVQRNSRANLAPRTVVGANTVSISAIRSFNKLLKSISNITHILNNGKEY